MAEPVSHDVALPGSLTIRCTADDRGAVVILGGELDLESAPELDRQLREVAGASPGRLLIDLSGLEFMDSTGLSVIVHAHRDSQANGHQLALRPGPPQVQRLFELTGVRQHLSFEE